MAIITWIKELTKYLYQQEVVFLSQVVIYKDLVEKLAKSKSDLFCVNYLSPFMYGVAIYIKILFLWMTNEEKANENSGSFFNYVCL